MSVERRQWIRLKSVLLMCTLQKKWSFELPFSLLWKTHGFEHFEWKVDMDFRVKKINSCWRIQFSDTHNRTTASMSFRSKSRCMKITKKSHSTLRAKRATFTVDKSLLKMSKKGSIWRVFGKCDIFGNFHPLCCCDSHDSVCMTIWWSFSLGGNWNSVKSTTAKHLPELCNLS